RVWLATIVLASLAAATPGSPQTKPVVKVGYIPSDSFAALYIMADRHLPAANIAVETVKLAGGPEILSQVATGQLNMGGTGRGAVSPSGRYRAPPAPRPRRSRRSSGTRTGRPRTPTSPTR